MDTRHTAVSLVQLSLTADPCVDAIRRLRSKEVCTYEPTCSKAAYLIGGMTVGI